MKKLNTLLLEQLLFKPPKQERASRKSKKDVEIDINVEDFIRLLRRMPQLTKEMQEALKAMEVEKKPDKKGLTIREQYMLATIAAVAGLIILRLVGL